VRFTGRDPHLPVHLPAWARTAGHGIAASERSVILKGDVGDRRLAGAVRAGSASAVDEHASPEWGLALRGALVEAGGPPLDGADIVDRHQVWSDLAPRLYAQAAARQWDPATAIDWSLPDLPDEVETAVIQVMTYLVENEQAALMIPARFIGRIHPHFREVQQFLAIQIADEARHVEVFSRRATLSGRPLGVSGNGGRASLQTLFAEPEWATASFLLSVLGEGSFLSLLAFLERWAPDPVTRQIARLTRDDEARHVAFALGHLSEHLAEDPVYQERLRAAIERRHRALAQTSGLYPAVRDALVIIAAGSWDPDAIGIGWDLVRGMEADMEEGRHRRLVRLGFPEADAAELSALHTRNFM
jgi:hypothetical protein